MKSKHRHLLLPLLALSVSITTYAQQPKVSLNTLQSAMDSAKARLPGERVYMQRLTFIRSKDDMVVTIDTNKDSYNVRDSVAVVLTANVNDNSAIQGNFSIVVTDDAQVKNNVAIKTKKITIAAGAK